MNPEEIREEPMGDREKRNTWIAIMFWCAIVLIESILIVLLIFGE